MPYVLTWHAIPKATVRWASQGPRTSLPQVAVVAGPRGVQGSPGPQGQPGVGADQFDPGDITLLFDNQLI